MRRTRQRLPSCTCRPGREPTQRRAWRPTASARRRLPASSAFSTSNCARTASGSTRSPPSSSTTPAKPAMLPAELLAHATQPEAVADVMAFLAGDLAAAGEQHDLPLTAPPADNWRWAERPRLAEGGGEQVAGGRAGSGRHFSAMASTSVLRRGMVELVRGLDGLAKREVTWQDDVFPLQRDEQGTLHGRGDDCRKTAVSSAISSSSDRPTQAGQGPADRPRAARRGP